MRRLFLYFVLNLWYNIAILIGGEHFEPRPNLPIQVKTLPNGFQYVIFKNQKPEGKVFIRLDVNMGSFFDKEGEEGLAHFLEHATFLGSDNFPQGFRKGLGCLGVKSTAFTEILYTKYVFDLQKNSAEAIDKIHGTHLTFICIIACRGIFYKKSKKNCRNRLNMLFKCDIVYTILRLYAD